MTALLELSPRVADGRTVEPSVEFDETVQVVRSANMCRDTCACVGNSETCTQTGTGFGG